jgi:hypothetical protein
MIFDMKRMVIELEYRGIVPLENAKGTRVDCLRGRIWITERGCTEDIVLETGESYEILRGGVAVVQALRDTVVALRAPTVPRPGRGLANVLTGERGERTYQMLMRCPGGRYILSPGFTPKAS